MNNPQPAAESRRRSIVVIEDVEDLAQTLVMLLEAEGFLADYATNGRSGLDLVRKAQPDAVLLDYGLPDMSGSAVGSELRRSGEFPGLKILMCTSTSDDTVKLDFNSYDAFLSKPVDLVTLVQTLERLLSNSGTGDAPDPDVDLAQFIRDNMEPVLVEFETFARTLVPPARTMTVPALRDHARDILLAIANDMATAQTEPARARKSRGKALPSGGETAAAAHGALRQLVGFDMNQLGAEFRALRAAVLHRWQAAGARISTASFEQMIRFNEGVDQALAESIAAYADRMTESRDMFLAVLGHDLRSPLGTLSNCTYILASEGTTKVSRDRTRLIAARSIATIDNMVTDLLDYTRTRLGRGIEVVPVSSDLGALCEQLFEDARAAHPHVPMTREVAGDLRLPFDEARMRQVIMNLLGNAIQHGDPDHAVSLKVEGDSNHVRVVVANRGATIAADSLQVIFEPMVQISKHRTRPSERPSTSLGLGLYIAQEIVNAHHGQISVTSTDEQGTIFTIRLPR